MVTESGEPASTKVNPGTVTGQLDLAQRTADFSAFYRGFVTKLVAFLIFQGCGTVEAADIAQETMIDAWRSWLAIKTPEAWARRVASRKFIARLASLEQPADLQGSPLLPSHVDVAAFEEQHAIVGLLRLLPPRERQVMAWIIDGYSVAEVAAELGLKPGAVSSYLHQARQRLAEHRGELS